MNDGQAGYTNNLLICSPMHSPSHSPMHSPSQMQSSHCLVNRNHHSRKSNIQLTSTLKAKAHLFKPASKNQPQVNEEYDDEDVITFLRNKELQLQSINYSNMNNKKTTLLKKEFNLDTNLLYGSSTKSGLFTQNQHVELNKRAVKEEQDKRLMAAYRSMLKERIDLQPLIFCLALP